MGTFNHLPIIELSFHFYLNWFQLPCQSVDLDLEVDPDFGQGWLAINNQEVAMVAGVVEHLDRPMAVESAVDSGFLVDTSPSLPLLAPTCLLLPLRETHSGEKSSRCN